MLRIIYVSTLLLFFTLSLTGQRKLSEHSRVSVLTCSQGEQLYSAFGHSAIRVSDTQHNIDWVFNYGTFDFNTPNFYMKFANGKLNYMLSVGEYSKFLPQYFKDNRNVTEQVLNIDLQERQRIFDALLRNYEPENRNYKYDFFYDNCATRIVDIIANNIDGEVVFDHKKDLDKVSFRKLLHHYLASSPWTETGLNIILGLPADKIATVRESTYLPYYLKDAFESASIHYSDGRSMPLIKEKLKVIDLQSQEPQDKGVWTPIVLFWGMLILAVFLSLILKLNFDLFDRILFFVTGCIGLLIAYLWLITDHSVTGDNLNILWAIPTFLLLTFSSYTTKLIRYVLLFNLLSIGVFLVGWSFLPQTFPAATIPIALLLGVRMFVIYKRNTKNTSECTVYTQK